MYEPQAFAEDRDDVVRDLVRAAGFGHLVVADSDGLASTPMPFVVDDDLGSVRAHLARPNPVWKAAPCDALLLVPVTDAYISPGWYPSKAAHGEVVPTWNYEVVHLYGRLVAHDDADWVRRQITELTDANEAALAAPWAVTDAPESFIARMQRGIVGLELIVDRVVAKRKLSQNRSSDDAIGAIAGLRREGTRGAAAVAASMATAVGDTTTDPGSR